MASLPRNVGEGVDGNKGCWSSRRIECANWQTVRARIVDAVDRVCEEEELKGESAKGLELETSSNQRGEVSLWTFANNGCWQLNSRDRKSVV